VGLGGRPESIPLSRCCWPILSASPAVIVVDGKKRRHRPGLKSRAGGSESAAKLAPIRHSSLVQAIMKSTSTGGLVYSTESGKMCPECRQAIARCLCKSALKAVPAGDGVARVSRQTKGRGGKSVTVITGLALDALALASLSKQLRTACGSGGTVKDGVIEVQGDHCERVIEMLKKAGHNAKRTGG
jgi:translation initiation factor 1